MSHPSIFTLKQFADAGVALEPADVAHVSTCPACSVSLQRLARRELRRRGVEAALPSASLEVRMPALAAVMAAAAVMAVMVTSRPVLHADEHVDSVSVVAPEGRHGVPPDDGLSFGHRASPLVDGGERLGSE